jgi:hypothetical protein
MMIGMSTHLVYIQSEASELGVLPQHGPIKKLVRLSALHVEVYSVIGSYSLFFIDIK